MKLDVEFIRETTVGDLGGVQVGMGSISFGKYKFPNGQPSYGPTCVLSPEDAKKPVCVGKGSVVAIGENKWQVVSVEDPLDDLGTVTLQKLIPHGPWLIFLSEEVHRDPWIHVRMDAVIRPDGVPGTFTIVNLKAGVCVLAIDEELNVYLTQEFHYGVGRVTLEGVSGGIEEDDDDVLETAQRELKEELGITADTWTQMGTVDPFTSSVVSPTQLYLAQSLTFGEDDQEGTEQISCVKMPLSEALQRVNDSEITHGPSCVVIL